MIEWKLVTEEEKEMARSLFRLLREFKITRDWRKTVKPWVSLIDYLENKRMKRLD